MGVESILAPFMRQAGLCTTAFTENVRICRVCSAALCPLRCVRREAAVVSGQEAAGVPGVKLALADADQAARIVAGFPLAAAGLITAGVIPPLPTGL
jgi:hypothetical protein